MPLADEGQGEALGFAADDLGDSTVAERYLRGTGLATDAQRARSPPTYVLDAGAPA